MSMHGKRYRTARESIDREQAYTPLQAVRILKDVPGAKFDENAVLHGQLTPVFFGSAISSFGIRELIDGSAGLRAGGQVELIFAVSNETSGDDLLAGVMTLPGDAVVPDANRSMLATAAYLILVGLCVITLLPWLGEWAAAIGLRPDAAPASAYPWARRARPSHSPAAARSRHC